MIMSNSLARCYQENGDQCFAYWLGCCQALQDTKFKYGPCTFFKTTAQIDAEQQKTIDRLRSFGLRRVLDKYRYQGRWD